jgi:hypothetical protein
MSITYYSPGMAIILFVSTISSFISVRLGIITATLITMGSIALTIVFGTVAITGYYEFLVFGLGAFPALSWVGLFLGRLIKNRINNRKNKD